MSAGHPDPTAEATTRRDALVERLFQATLGAMDVLAVYVGDRLGLYRTLAERGPLSSRELAAATGTHERYVREWLEQQAASAILEVDDAAAAAEARRYKLLDAAQERWGRCNGLELVADVLAGATYKDGIRVTEDDTTTTEERVAA